MTLTETLRSEIQDLWTHATTHDFTNALADGTLDHEKLRGYLQQDYLFIEEFVRLLAAMISHTPKLADGLPGAQFLGLISGPENTYFVRSFEAMDIPSDAPPAPETRAFQNLMREARESGRLEFMLAVLVVAEWIYLEWATPFEDRVDGLPFYLGEWITLHSGPGFSGVVANFRGRLDAVWQELSASAQDETRDIFRRAVQLEADFFDASEKGFPVNR